MRTTTRKGLPLADVTDTATMTFTVGIGIRQTTTDGVVRDTVDTLASLLDGFTDYGIDEQISGRWEFQSPAITDNGIGQLFVNNTGAARVVGDVVMIDAANDSSVILPNAIGVSAGKIGVVAESIAIGALGRVAFSGFIRVRCAAGTVSRLQYLQTQNASSLATGTTYAGTGAFAIAVTGLDINNTCLAALHAGSSNLEGGGTIYGTLNVGANQANYIEVTGAAAGSSPQILTQGSDANSGLWLESKGTGSVLIGSAQDGAVIVAQPVAGSVNYLQVNNAAAGGRPTISSQGADANIGILIQTKGTGDILFYNGTNIAQFVPSAGAVNFVQIYNNVTGAAPAVGVSGSDANVNFNLTSKGTGLVTINSSLVGFNIDSGSRLGASAISIIGSGNNAGQFAIQPGGTATYSLLRLYNSPAGVNTGSLDIQVSGATASINGGGWGTGTLVNVLNVNVNQQLQRVGVGAAPNTSYRLLVQGDANNYGTYVVGSSTSGQSDGLIIAAGTTSADYALNIVNQSAGSTFLRVLGSGQIQTYSGAGTNGLIVNGAANNYAQIIGGTAGAGTSFGLEVEAGTNATDISLEVTNQAQTYTSLQINGAGAVIVNAGNNTIGNIVPFSVNNPNAATVQWGSIYGNGTTMHGVLVQAGSTSSHDSFRVDNGAGTYTGFVVFGNGAVQVNPGAASMGAVTPLLVYGSQVAGAAAWATTIFANNTTTYSQGLAVYAGTNTSDNALDIFNRAASAHFLRIRGDGAVLFNESRMVPASTGVVFLYGASQAYTLYLQGSNVTTAGYSLGAQLQAGYVNGDVILNCTDMSGNGVFQVQKGTTVLINASQTNPGTSNQIFNCYRGGGSSYCGQFLTTGAGTGTSFGLSVYAGSSNGDTCLGLFNQANTFGSSIRGDGVLLMAGGTVVNQSFTAGQFYAYDAPNVANASGQGVAQAWTTWSMPSAKADLEPLGGALDLVRHISPIRYNHLTRRRIRAPHPEHGRHTWQHIEEKMPSVGFDMHEVLEHLPELISRTPDGRAAGIDYGRMAAVAWSAVKELAEQVTMLQTQVAEMKGTA